MEQLFKISVIVGKFILGPCLIDPKDDFNRGDMPVYPTLVGFPDLLDLPFYLQFKLSYKDLGVILLNIKELLSYRHDGLFFTTLPHEASSFKNWSFWRKNHWLLYSHSCCDKNSHRQTQAVLICTTF